MDRNRMSHEEDYFFDVTGYLRLPGVLAIGEVDRLNRALDEAGRDDGMLGWPAPLRTPFRDLLIHPRLVWYLNQVIGYGFRLDSEPELLCDQTSDGTFRLVGGNEPRQPGRAYYHQNGRRICEAVRAVWALSDVNEEAGGFGLVPRTHKSNVETPEELATGVDDMGQIYQPVVKAGDLLLVAGSLLQGMRPWNGNGPRRLLSYEYVGRGVIHSAGTGQKTMEEPFPEWQKQISIEQRASLYRPGYQQTTPSPTIATDGSAVKLDPSRQVFHPSFYRRDPNSGIDHKEFYFWDLNGYLILPGVMDEAWLAEANEAIDEFEDRIVVGEELGAGSKSLAGTGRPLLSGLLELPDPHNGPFRRMIAHPAVEHRLNWMGGSGGRCQGPISFCSVQGSSGHSLHSNNEPLYPPMGYVFQNGRSYDQALTVAFQLRDVEPGMGGFACVPGTHKALYPMPEGVRSCDDDMGLVVQPSMKAGDVLFFGDGATAHGATAWKNSIPRRSILIKYTSRHFHRDGGEMVEPEDRWGRLVEGMTEAQISVMRGPDRDRWVNNVPRLQVQNGEVSVSSEPAVEGSWSEILASRHGEGG